MSTIPAPSYSSLPLPDELQENIVDYFTFADIRSFLYVSKDAHRLIMGIIETFAQQLEHKKSCTIDYMVGMPLWVPGFRSAPSFLHAVSERLTNLTFLDLRSPTLCCGKDFNKGIAFDSQGFGNTATVHRISEIFRCGHPKLTTLLLSQEQVGQWCLVDSRLFPAIEQSLSRCPALTALDLFGFSILNADLLGCLSQHQSLEKLRLGSSGVYECFLTRQETSLETCLQRLRNLRVLALGGRSITNDFAFAIARSAQQLTSLNLSRSLVEGVGLVEILNNCTQLTHLDVSHTRANINDPVLQLVGTHLKQLRFLNLNSTAGRSSYSDSGLENLARRCTTLEWLYLNPTRCTWPGIASLLTSRENMQIVVIKMLQECLTEDTPANCQAAAKFQQQKRLIDPSDPSNKFYPEDLWR